MLQVIIMGIRMCCCSQVLATTLIGSNIVFALNDKVNSLSISCSYCAWVCAWEVRGVKAIIVSLSLVGWEPHQEDTVRDRTNKMSLFVQHSKCRWNIFLWESPLLVHPIGSTPLKSSWVLSFWWRKNGDKNITLSLCHMHWPWPLALALALAFALALGLGTGIGTSLHHWLWLKHGHLHWHWLKHLAPTLGSGTGLWH